MCTDEMEGMSGRVTSLIEKKEAFSPLLSERGRRRHQIHRRKRDAERERPTNW